MAQWMTTFLAAIAAIVFVAESRVIPAEPISVMLDAYGNPVVFLREKRTAVHPYPHRAMMFTGYYRPVRRTSNGGQATGVFAQGNAVSGEAFFGGMQAPHLENGPEPIQEPIQEPEVSSAEAQAAPGGDESYNEEEDQPQVQDEERYNPEVHHEEQHPQQEEHHHNGEHHHHEHHDGHHQEEEQHHGPQPGQEQADPEPVPAAPATPAVPVEEPVQPNPEVPAERPKVHHGKKTKKTPVVVDEDDEEYEEEDEEPVVPFVPFKGNRRRQGYPNLNNFFPMVFSFPGASTRSGSSGSPPGTITAIANSYSTGKGGVASSVATAYGGSPNGKKRRTPAASEE